MKPRRDLGSPPSSRSFSPERLQLPNIRGALRSSSESNCRKARSGGEPTPHTEMRLSSLRNLFRQLLKRPKGSFASMSLVHGRRTRRIGHSSPSLQTESIGRFTVLFWRPEPSRRRRRLRLRSYALLRLVRARSVAFGCGLQVSYFGSSRLSQRLNGSNSTLVSACSTET